jgi:hypothetical protein
MRRIGVLMTFNEADNGQARIDGIAFPVAPRKLHCWPVC